VVVVFVELNQESGDGGLRTKFIVRAAAVFVLRTRMLVPASQKTTNTRHEEHSWFKRRCINRRLLSTLICSSVRVTQRECFPLFG
jgi:hypothetical protein